jgi:hypothetical protein
MVFSNVSEVTRKVMRGLFLLNIFGEVCTIVNPRCLICSHGTGSGLVYTTQVGVHHWQRVWHRRRTVRPCWW